MCSAGAAQAGGAGDRRASLQWLSLQSSCDLLTHRGHPWPHFQTEPIKAYPKNLLGQIQHPPPQLF